MHSPTEELGKILKPTITTIPEINPNYPIDRNYTAKLTGLSDSEDAPLMHKILLISDNNPLAAFALKTTCALIFGYWVGTGHHTIERLLLPTSLLAKLESTSARRRQWMAYLGGFAIVYQVTEKLVESWVGYHDYRAIGLATFASFTTTLGLKTLKPFRSFGLGITIGTIMGANDYFFKSTLAQRLTPESIKYYGPDQSPAFPVDGIHEKLLEEKKEKLAKRMQPH